MTPISCLVVAALAAGAAYAKTIPIKVLDDVFEPNTTTADAGDVLEFHFLPHNHSVVMGDFSDACQPAKTGGFYSGFLATKEGEAPQPFRVRVNDTKPIVYYCSQGGPGGGHCQEGMVGTINPAEPGALRKYADAAAKVYLAKSPAAPFGGSLDANPSASGGGGGSEGPSPTASSTAGTTVPSSGAARYKDASLGAGVAVGVLALLAA